MIWLERGFIKALRWEVVLVIGRWWNYTGRKFLEGRGETSEGGLEFFLLLKNDTKCIIHGDLSWKVKMLEWR